MKLLTELIKADVLKFFNHYGLPWVLANMDVSRDQVLEILRESPARPALPTRRCCVAMQVSRNGKIYAEDLLETEIGSSYNSALLITTEQWAIAQVGLDNLAHFGYGYKLYKSRKYTGRKD